MVLPQFDLMYCTGCIFSWEINLVDWLSNPRIKFPKLTIAKL